MTAFYLGYDDFGADDSEPIFRRDKKRSFAAKQQAKQRRVQRWAKFEMAYREFGR